MRAAQLSLLGFVGIAFACASDRKPFDRGSLVGSIYTNHALDLRVEAPEGWTLETDRRSVPPGTRVSEYVSGTLADRVRHAAKHELFTMSARNEAGGDLVVPSLSASATLLPAGSSFDVETYADAIEHQAKSEHAYGGQAAVAPRRWTEIAGRRFLVVPMTLTRETPRERVDLYLFQEERLFLALGAFYAPDEHAAMEEALQAITRLGPVAGRDE